MNRGSDLDGQARAHDWKGRSTRGFVSLKLVRKINDADRGAIAAQYGSTSLVTFTAALLFLENSGIEVTFPFNLMFGIPLYLEIAKKISSL